MALTLPPMSMEVSVSDVAATLMESENGLMLKLPVSLNLPIIELLQALQSVQEKSCEPPSRGQPDKPKESAPFSARLRDLEARGAEILETQAGTFFGPPPHLLETHMQPPFVAPAPAAGIAPPPGLLLAPSEEPMGLSGVAAHSLREDLVTKSLSAQPQEITWDTSLADLQPMRQQPFLISRYDISASTKNWILRDEDLLECLNPVPIKRKVTTPEVLALAAVAGTADEPLKQVMDVPLPDELAVDSRSIQKISNTQTETNMTTLHEASKEEEEEDNEQDEHGEPKRMSLLSVVEFEPPNPGLIFQNIADEHLWRELPTSKTSFTFDGQKFARKHQSQKIFLRNKPFLRGGKRLAYGMLHDEHKAQSDNNKNWMCAKRLFRGDPEIDQSSYAHAAFCKSTAVAQYYSKMFAALMKHHDTKFKFGFLDCHLYSYVDDQQKGFHFCGEELLLGHLEKLHSLPDYVNTASFSVQADSDTAQAFSHFTFDRSRGQLMVVDLHGICGDDNEGGLYCLLTGPQVYSRGTFETFGAYDLGEHGMRKFFKKHKCGEMCRLLGIVGQPNTFSAW